MSMILNYLDECKNTNVYLKKKKLKSLKEQSRMLQFVRSTFDFTISGVARSRVTHAPGYIRR